MWSSSSSLANEFKKQAKKEAKCGRKPRCPCPCACCGGGIDTDASVECLHLVYICGHSDMDRRRITSASSACGDDEAGEMEGCGDEPPDDLSEEIIKQGWLKKRGGGTSGRFGSTQFRTRWFLLRGHCLKYYKEQTSAGGKPANGWILLSSHCCITPTRNDPMEFMLKTRDRSFVIAGTSASETAEWISVLTGILNRLEF